MANEKNKNNNIFLAFRGNPEQQKTSPNKTARWAFALCDFHTLWLAAFQSWRPVNGKIWTKIVILVIASTYPILSWATIKTFKIHPQLR